MRLGTCLRLRPGWDDRIASGASWSSPEPRQGTRRLAYLCLPQIRNWTKVLRSLAATSFLRCDGLAWTMELPPHALLDTLLRPQSRSANLDARGCGLAASHAERKCPSHGLAWFCHLGWGLAQVRGENTSSTAARTAQKNRIGCLIGISE